jgi:hypothetical protein
MHFDAAFGAGAVFAGFHPLLLSLWTVTLSNFFRPFLIFAPVPESANTKA